jgi:hypothetical protein
VLRLSREIGNPTSHEPTIFYILKSCIWTVGKPTFLMALAYFLAASLLKSSDLAPVQTILPDVKISAVVLGSLILMMTAANRLGLYSAFLQLRAIFLRSNLEERLAVETMF